MSLWAKRVLRDARGRRAPQLSVESAS